MRVRRDAEELRPEELIKLRALLSRVDLDHYLESSEVANRLGLHNRTVLDLSRAGEFDGKWGKAFKPAHNRVRIPIKGVRAWMEKNAMHAEAAAFFSRENDGADASTEEVSG